MAEAAALRVRSGCTREEAPGRRVGLGLSGLRLSPRPEGTVLVVRVELDGSAVDVLPELRVEGPVVLRGEALDLALPVDDQRERRALNPADGQEVASHLLRGDGQESGENGAPGEIDGLPRFGGPRERIVDVHEVRECPLDFPLRERGETCASNPDLRAGLLDDLERLDADQLALAVEVRRDDDLVDVRRELAEGGADLPLGDDLLRLRPDELFEVDPRPIVEGLRVVEVDDVAAQPDDAHAVVALHELEDGRPVATGALRLPVAEDGRDPNGRVELLRYDEPAHGRVRTRGALFNDLALDVAMRWSFARAFTARARTRRLEGLRAQERPPERVSCAAGIGRVHDCGDDRDAGHTATRKQRSVVPRDPSDGEDRDSGSVDDAVKDIERQQRSFRFRGAREERTDGDVISARSCRGLFLSRPAIDRHSDDRAGAENGPCDDR